MGDTPVPAPRRSKISPPVPKPRRHIQDNAQAQTTPVRRSRLIGEDISRRIEDSLKNTRDMIMEQGSLFTFSSLRKKKTVLSVPMEERTVSMPPTDTTMFDSIQFQSPFKEQPQYGHLDSNSTSSFASRAVDSSDGASEASDYSMISNLSTTLENLYNTPRNSQASPHYGTISESLNGDILQQEPLQPIITKQTKHSACYENWNTRPIPQPRLSKSMIDQFDPLNELPINIELENDLSVLESLLAGDTYGSTREFADNAISDDSECEFFWENGDSFTSPPTPPERYDSLQNDNENDKKNNTNRNTQWYLDSNNSNTGKDVSQKTPPGGVMNRFSNMFKLGAESASFLKKKIESKTASSLVVPEALTIPQTMHNHRGLMMKLSAGGMEEIFKNFQPRLYILAEKKLTGYSDRTISNVKDVYFLKNFLSLQIIMSHKFNYDGELHCFQLNYSNPNSFKSSRSSAVFGCTNEGDRASWVYSIIESVSNVFPSECITDFSRFGWCYLKEGVSGTWEAAWLLLRKRSIHYCTNQDRTIHNMDLKKTRFVVLKEVEDKKDLPGEDKTILLLDFPGTTLYLQMGTPTETTMWRKVIKKAALNNGAWIHHQQLTKDNIPTLVDKCINFVYTHGSLSEGIYRKVGTASVVTSLLAAFRQDAWAVQLTRNDYTEHEVATALKRFFRDLPESLMTAKLRDQFCSAAEMDDVENKIAVYKELISELHPVSYNTLKKVIAHLHFIQSLQEDNFMNSANLAAVWGPTLMTCPGASEAEWSRRETVVVRDLIDYYERVYEPSEEDSKKEKLLLTVLKKYQQSNNALTANKRSGDFQVWIYLNDKTSGDCVSVLISPSKTCGDICEQLSDKMNMRSDMLMLVEFIADEKMSRPLHHTEILLNVVIRWGYWEDGDRKDNCLVIKENHFLTKIAATVIPPMYPNSFVMELKYASDKHKSFKMHFLKFSQDKIICYKDRNCTNVLGTWPIDKIRWYIGHESKRNPQSKWSLTFIDRSATTIRTKDRPYFGHIIAGNNDKELEKWIGAFLYAEYPDAIIPIPLLIKT